MKFKKSIIITLIILIFSSYSIPCYGNSYKEKENIIIGCWPDDPFLCEKNQKVFKGYLPDYLKEMKRYFDFYIDDNNYSFKYIFGSPEELKAKLKNGEIDAMVGYPTSKDSKETNFINTAPIAEFQMTLSTEKNNNDYYFMNEKHVDGKKIGYFTPLGEKLLNKFAHISNLSINEVYFSSRNKLENALKNNSIDLACVPFHFNNEDTKIINNIGLAHLCFITNNDNPISKLLKNGVDYLDNTYSNLKYDLYQKHINNINYSLADTIKEQQLKNDNYVIKFATIKDDSLLCFDKKLNRYVGPYGALLEYISQTCKLPFEIIYINSIDEALKSDADVLVGMVASEQLMELYNMSFTDPYLYGFNSFWTKKNKKIDFNNKLTLGTVRNIESVNTHIREYYPKWNIKNYASIKDAIRAVNSGAVDIIMMDNIVEGNDFEGSDELDRLYDFNIPCLDLSMGINRNKDTASTIESLLNKSFRSTSNEKMTSMLYNNKTPTYSIKAAIKQYQTYINLSLIILLILLVFYLYFLYKRVYKAAYFSRETGIYNKNFLFKHGTELCKAGTTIINIDIAKLKQINMSWGVIVGDAVRKFVATELLKDKDKGILVSETTALNFVCILPFKDKTSIEDYLAYISKKISTYKNDNLLIPLEYHIGIYINETGDDIYTSVLRAELALFEAKRIECQREYFNISLEEKQRNEKIIEDKMQTALDNKEFKLYLQPQFNSVDKTLSGAEALVRWIEKDGNIIYPDEFIPLFEKNHFILKLDEYMFRKACALQRELIDDGYTPVTIAVNQSRLNLTVPNYANKLKSIIDSYSLPYELLEIEVTEYIYSTEEEISAILDDLKNIGFKVSIDDFGSGYSSLNIISNKNLDCIKIDKEFLRGDKFDEKTKRVITTIVEVTKSLSVDCVCEGVETQEHVDFLTDINCRYLQGYYFSTPIPVNSFINKYYKLNQ